VCELCRGTPLLGSTQLLPGLRPFPLDGRDQTRSAHSGLDAKGHVPHALNGSGAHDAPDEHSGAEVRAEHRPHLGAEQRTRAEDLGALSDQMLGVLG
jgi:hypothetical protein